jgi:hypothetical protein
MKKLGAISDNKINLGAILVICRIKKLTSSTKIDSSETTEKLEIEK